uniref:C-type lectin domain-containing protein n=1 Tax=Dicentrarchus labrax TaxID=13489 RepID=A0A8C4ENM8_DICLA
MEIDDDVYINKNLTMEGDFQRKKQPSRCVNVCLGLLCAILLAGNIAQIIYCNKNHLQISYNSLWKEKEQLKTSCNTLQKEKENLQTNCKIVCQTGWFKFDISCYFVSTLKKNWTLSRQDCITRGADLVSIDGMDEQEFVHGLLRTGQNAWIGLTDSLKEGTWMWVDGEPVTTSYWQPGQPNSYNGNQDCGEMVEKSGMGEWNDDGCFAEQIWICEK